MSATLTFDDKAFRSGLLRLAEVKGKSEEEILKEAAKLMLRYAVRFTPPFGEHPVREAAGLKDSRKIGEKAVRRDLQRTYHSIRSLDIYRHLINAEAGRRFNNLVRNGDVEGVRNAMKAMEMANPEAINRFQKLVRKGDVEGVRNVMQAIGMANADPVLYPSVTYHASKRDRRGRVSKSNAPRTVLRHQTLGKFIRKKVSHVGKAKAGWAISARALKVKLPKWVARHADIGGTYQEAKTIMGNVWQIICGNFVRYQGGFHPEKIIAAAAKQAGISMRIQAAAIMKRRMEKMDKSRPQLQLEDA